MAPEAREAKPGVSPANIIAVGSPAIIELRRGTALGWAQGLCGAARIAALVEAGAASHIGDEGLCGTPSCVVCCVLDMKVIARAPH